jgi:hypothetical protein
VATPGISLQHGRRRWLQPGEYAAWDKPLWDAYPLFGNEDWMMEAPSFAGAVDLVVQVVATIATAPVGGFGGAVLGAAIGSVDDLMFTALEVGTQPSDAPSQSPRL